MNDEQKLRLRVASEQMAAMTVESVPTDSLSACVVICRKHEYRGDGLEDRMAFAAVKMADALIAEVKRTGKAAPEQHPGWVVEDGNGHAWGYVPGDNEPWDIEEKAKRPFPNRSSAEIALRSIDKVFPDAFMREWRPTDHVPPMPEGE